MLFSALLVLFPVWCSLGSEPALRFSFVRGWFVDGRLHSSASQHLLLLPTFHVPEGNKGMRVKMRKSRTQKKTNSKKTTNANKPNCKKSLGTPKSDPLSCFLVGAWNERDEKCRNVFGGVLRQNARPNFVSAEQSASNRNNNDRSYDNGHNGANRNRIRVCWTWWETFRVK